MKWETGSRRSPASAVLLEGPGKTWIATTYEPDCTPSPPDPRGSALTAWVPVDTDGDRYPQKLAFAECLCGGCIDARTGRETAALNSVHLLQSLLVLRRRPCSVHGVGPPTPGAFAFHAEFIRVPVGCTCVLPRSV
ncbi:Interleukin-17C [Plecturocebus cupreus]